MLAPGAPVRRAEPADGLSQRVFRVRRPAEPAGLPLAADRLDGRAQPGAAGGRGDPGAGDTAAGTRRLRRMVAPPDPGGDAAGPLDQLRAGLPPPARHGPGADLY